MKVVDQHDDRDDRTPQIPGLVRATCAGDPQAWQALWAWLDPRLALMVRRFRLGRISSEEDERRGVVLEVMARLREDDFRRLRLFADAAERDPALALMSWLRVVVKRVAIDYMRGHPSYLDTRRDGASVGPGHWKDPEPLPAASLLPGVRPTMTRDGTARELLAHAAEVLPERHYQALVLKIGGEAPADIARRLQLSGAAEVEKIVRAGLERLRRKFRTTLSGGQS
jgi:DNA-directed RNA polymerase specialized sigma24 family protein